MLHWVPLTGDPSAIRCAPPFMKPENVPNWMGGTMIGKALLACKEILTSREEGDRMIILVSDGDSFDLSNGNDESIAQTLKRSDITVFAIHINSSDPPPEIVTITGLTGGEVFPVDDPQALQAVFQRIDAMKATKLEKTAPSCSTTSRRSARRPVGPGPDRSDPVRPEVHAMVMVTIVELATAAAAILAAMAELLHAATVPPPGPAGLRARPAACALGTVCPARCGSRPSPRFAGGS